MNGRKFEPVKSGPRRPVRQSSQGPFNNEERRQAGTPATLEGNIDIAIDVTENTAKSLQQQPYPVRWLKQRYGLPLNFAAFLAAEFRWGGV
jgi:hypothetical protein